MNEDNQENDQPEKPDEHNDDDIHYDKNGQLLFKLELDDSALVVRSDGTIEMVSHDLESSDEGYMGDVEDLSKTFSLVLALVSALENEDLYNRIFHNLNMILMKKWEVMDDDTKDMIIQKRKKISDELSPEEEKEKTSRVDEFRKRMNKYKDTFLDDMENDKKRLKSDLRDEAEWHKKFGRDFGANPDMKDMDMEDTMETRKKIKKVKPNPLVKLNGVNWNPYDKTLKTHWKEWRSDESPDIEDDA